MDMSCSLDVLVCRDLPASSNVPSSEPMAAVIRSTQAKIDAAFEGAGKVTAKLKARHAEAV